MKSGDGVDGFGVDIQERLPVALSKRSVDYYY